MSGYVITTTQFEHLNALLQERRLIDLEKADLDQRDAGNRTAILNLMDEIGLDNRAVPGVMVKVTTDVQIDESEVLAWALADANFAHAAPVLTVSKNAIGIVIEKAMHDERLKSVFEMDKTGAKKAAREGMYLDMPVAGVQESRSVAITSRSLKTGDELAECFTVVEPVETEDEAV